MAIEPAVQSTSGRARFFRYAVYLVYALARLWRMKHDAAFPLYDGWTYYAKAVFLSEEPRVRLFSSEAFSFLSGRPPAPMWLTAPFVWVAPVFSVFALALIFWTLFGVEWGVRCVVPRRRPWTRFVLAVLIVAGVGPFYHGFELFYVDTLLTGMAVASLGCAIAWLRRARWSYALVGGIWLFLAILTKPAGLALSACVGGTLVTGWCLKVWRKGRPPCFVRAPGRFWFAVCAWGVPVLIAASTLWLTPYRTILTGAHKVFSTATLSRHYLVSPWSVAGVKDFLRMAFGTVGMPILVVFVVLGVWGVFGLWRRGSRLRAPATAAVLGALAMAAFAFLVPSRQARFFAPVAGMGFLAMGMVFSSVWGKRGRILLAVLAVGVVGFRVAAIGNMLPRPDLLGWSEPFSFPLHEVRADLDHVDDSLREDTTGGEPVVFATDVGVLVESLKLVEWLHAEAPRRAACQLPPYRPFCLVSPRWPDYDSLLLTRFPFARMLIVQSPVGGELPAGSGSRDWQIVNTALWDADCARQLGWIEVVRREWYVVYKSTASETESGNLWCRRGRFLTSLPLESASSRQIFGALERRALPLGFSPSGRKTVVSKNPQTWAECLLHVEYEGNPLPCEARFPFEKDGILHFDMPRKGLAGDGIVVILSVKVGEGWTEVRRVSLPQGSKLDVPLTDLVAGEGENSTQLRIQLDPGPRADTTNDLLCVFLETPKS